MDCSPLGAALNLHHQKWFSQRTNARKESSDKIPQNKDVEQTYHGINLRWQVLGDETSLKDPDLNDPPFSQLAVWRWADVALLV